MSLIGAGLKEIVQERINSGVPKNKLEHPDYADFSIYIARTHVIDHETGVIARGPCKIGRAKYINNVQRARNQGGGDFRIYKTISVTHDSVTRDIEKYISKKYKNRKFKGSQTQSELYDFTDNELTLLIDDIKSKFTNNIKEIKDYSNGNTSR
jgi:hypothetical protein